MTSQKNYYVVYTKYNGKNKRDEWVCESYTR